MRDEGHVPELDGLRGIAALSVLVFHAQEVLGGGWVTVLARWSRGGWLGVDLFFVLSGYLITRGLLADRGHPSMLRRFYARRILRIAPLYYLYLAVVFAGSFSMRWYDLAPGDRWLFLAYLGNAPAAGGHFPGWLLAPLWSLAVEEHFYAMWPLVVRGRDDRGLLRVCVTTAVVAMLARWGAGAVLDVDAPYILTLCRVDTLLTGAALALLARTYGATRVVAACRARIYPALLWLVTVALTPLGPSFLPNVLPSRAYTLVGYTLTALACAVIVGSVAHGAPPVPWLRARPLVYVGKVSYGVYLLHVLVGWALVRAFPALGRGPVEGTVLVFAAVTVLVATVAHAVVDRPFTALRRRFPWEVTR